MRLQREFSRSNLRLEGRYANFFKVGHNAFEFVLDFGQYYQEEGEERLHTRIITSPVHAKALLAIIQESVDRYIEVFSSIEKL